MRGVGSEGPGERKAVIELHTEAPGVRTRGEERVRKEALEMVVVLGTRSLRKGLCDPVQCGMEVSPETQGQREGAMKGWRGSGQKMQSPAEGRDS